MMTIVALLFLILILAVLLWWGDRILALAPGNPKLKELVRTSAIALVAILLICLIAAFFGVKIPWFSGFVHFRAG
jgi:hypothetical protein